MKRVGQFLVVATVAVAASLSASAVLIGPPETRRATSKWVQIVCEPGWRGSLGGQYGGVGFTLACTNGRATTLLRDTTGTSYSIRMGVESSSTGLDCFFSGDDRVVTRSCGSVTLAIR